MRHIAALTLVCLIGCSKEETAPDRSRLPAGSEAILVDYWGNGLMALPPPGWTHGGTTKGWPLVKAGVRVLIDADDQPERYGDFDRPRRDAPTPKADSRLLRITVIEGEHKGLVAVCHRPFLRPAPR